MWHCGGHRFDSGIDSNTIREANVNPKQYIYNNHNTSLERHRQAVYTSMNTNVDYVIFNDAENLDADICQDTLPSTYKMIRGIGRPVYVVSISDPNARREFQELLRKVLSPVPIATLHACRSAFHVIRQHLMDNECMTDKVMTLLIVQVYFEWGYFVRRERYSKGSSYNGYKNE